MSRTRGVAVEDSRGNISRVVYMPVDIYFIIFSEVFRTLIRWKKPTRTRFYLLLYSHGRPPSLDHQDV